MKKSTLALAITTLLSTNLAYAEINNGHQYLKDSQYEQFFFGGTFEDLSTISLVGNAESSYLTGFSPDDGNVTHITTTNNPENFKIISAYGSRSDTSGSYDITSKNNYLIIDGGEFSYQLVGNNVTSTSPYDNFLMIHDSTTKFNADGQVFFNGGSIIDGHNVGTMQPNTGKIVPAVVYGSNVNVFETYSGTVDQMPYVSVKSDVTNNGKAFINDGVVNADISGANTEIFLAALLAYKKSDDDYTLNDIRLKTHGESVINGGEIYGNIYGSSSDLTQSYGNQTKMYVTTIADISGNVTINAGTVHSGDISNSTNKTNMIAGATVTYHEPFMFYNPGNEPIESVGNFTATGNVTIGPDAVIEDGFDIYGVNYVNDYQTILMSTVKNKEVFSGNTLSISSSPVTARKVGNFENYNFYINDNNNQVIADKNGQYMLKVTDSLNNDNSLVDNESSLNSANVKIMGVSGTYQLKDGDRINLIDLSEAKIVNVNNVGDPISGATNDNTETTIKEAFNQLTQDKIKIGLIGEGTIDYVIDDNDNTIYAKVTEIKKGDDNPLPEIPDVPSDRVVDINGKPLAEGRLATLLNASRGNDELLSMLGKNEDVGTFTPMAKISGGVNKYGNSDNNVNSNDYRLIVGTRYQFTDNFYAGLSAEYGVSNYDTKNAFSTGDVNGSGNTKNYAATLFAKYTNNDVYAKAAVSFGRTSNDYRSNDIVTGAGTSANYNSDANYLSALLSLGYTHSINNAYGLDTSATYYFTKLNSDSVVIDGDSVNFGKATSSRINLREELSYKASLNSTAYFAVAYEYEFDGKANTSIEGFKVNAHSVKGPTGIAELGIKGTPLNNKDLELDFNVKAYSGERDGVIASIYAQYNF